MDLPDPDCQPADHVPATAERLSTADEVVCQRAADLFRMLGDPARLRICWMLAQREMCVTEIAETLDDSLPAVSQRLRLLKAERIVRFRREGKHTLYRLDDAHISHLLADALDHAREPRDS